MSLSETPVNDTKRGGLDADLAQTWQNATMF